MTNRSPLLSAYAAIVNMLITLKLGKVPGVRPLYHLVQNHFISRIKGKSVTVDGHLMYLDSKDSLNLSVFGTFEPVETEVVKQEIGTGAVVLDIGANIGYFTLLFARLAGPAGKVFAFEAFPQNAEILKKNISVNGYSNVLVETKAISNTSGKTTFFLSAESNGLHSLRETSGAETIQVETVAIDEYFATYDGRIDFIKMDIEGAELSALQGMQKTLRAHPEAKVFLEFAPMNMAAPETQAPQLLALLSTLGFTIYDIDNDAKARVKSNAADILSKYTLKKKNHGNLLCVRS